MACCDDSNYDKDWKKWKKDGWYENFCTANCTNSLCTSLREVVKVILIVFCLCVVDAPKWSWKALHHATMAFCSFILMLLAIISFGSFAQIQQQAQDAATLTGSGSCILFASYEGDHVELNTDAHSCSFAIGGEVIIFLCALLLIVWFWVKARLGIGSKLDSIWLNLLQLLLLILLLIIGSSCAAIMNAGLNHTCRSHVPDNIPSSGQSPEVLIGQPCDMLYFQVGYDYTPVMFYHKVSTAYVTAWIGVVVLLLMLIATIVSFVGYQCRKDGNVLSMIRKLLGMSGMSGGSQNTPLLPPGPNRSTVGGRAGWYGIPMTGPRVAPQQRFNRPPATQHVPPQHQAPPTRSNVAATMSANQTVAPATQTAPTTQPTQPVQPAQPAPVGQATPPPPGQTTPSLISTTPLPVPTSPLPVPARVGSSPQDGDSVWPKFGDSVYVDPQIPLDQQGQQSAQQPSLTPAAQLTADVSPVVQGSVRVFSLPCHFAPLFGVNRVRHGVVLTMETKHGVTFSILDTAGSCMQLSSESLCKSFDSIFNDNTPAAGKSVGEIDGPSVDSDRIRDYLTSTLSTKFQWLWQDDSGGFCPFDPGMSVTLQTNYNLGPEGSFIYYSTARQCQYTIDFASMTQTNNKTKRRRMIKYEAVSIVWQYMNARGRFVSHSNCNSEAIERMHVVDKPTTLKIDGKEFAFDFSNMRQTDTSTSQAYKIRRRTLPCSKPIAAYELTLQVEGPKEKLDAAIADLKGELGKKLQSMEHSIGEGQASSLQTNSVSQTRTVNRTVQTFLLQKACCYFVSVLVTPNKIELHGVTNHIKQVMLSLQQLLLVAEKNALRAIELPDSWSPQTGYFHLARVQSGTPEWTHVQGLVQATLPHAQIQRIERVQNVWLWEKYEFAKQRLSNKNKGVINEKELFHGTSANPPEKVLKSEHGFDFRVAKQGMWGEGAYFAVKASYSGSSYGYSYSSGTRVQIILARVLTGDTYRCQPDRSLKQPPKKPRSGRAEESFEDECYDSVSGHSGGSEIYIVYDHDKAYPAYLITYSNSTV